MVITAGTESHQRLWGITCYRTRLRCHTTPTATRPDGQDAADDTVPQMDPGKASQMRQDARERADRDVRLARKRMSRPERKDYDRMLEQLNEDSGLYERNCYKERGIIGSWVSRCRRYEVGRWQRSKRSSGRAARRRAAGGRGAAPTRSVRRSRSC